MYACVLTYCTYDEVGHHIFNFLSDLPQELGQRLSSALTTN